MGSRAARRSYATAFRVAGRLLVAGLIVFLALRLWQLWSRRPINFAQIDGSVLAAAAVACSAGVTGYGLVWPYVLRRLGVRAPMSWIGLYFKGQLGKYLPGSVWQYAGRAAMVRSRGVPVQVGLVSLAVEVVASAAAAAIVALLVLPVAWTLAGWAALAALTAVSAALRRRIAAGIHRLRLRAVPVARLDRATLAAGLQSLPAAVALYVLVWVAYGLGFWLTARALFAVPASQLPLYIGVFATGWVVGFIVIFAPGGLGIRDAVIVALLSSRIGEAHAIALAAASRLILTAVDLAGGVTALALPLLYRHRRRPASAAE
jgi:glycosyltransferase 2 family protein